MLLEYEELLEGLKYAIIDAQDINIRINNKKLDAIVHNLLDIHDSLYCTFENIDDYKTQNQDLEKENKLLRQLLNDALDENWSNKQYIKIRYGINLEE